MDKLKLQNPNCTEVEFKENERLIGTRAIAPYNGLEQRSALAHCSVCLGVGPQSLLQRECLVRTDYEHLFAFVVKASSPVAFYPRL